MIYLTFLLSPLTLVFLLFIPSLTWAGDRYEISFGGQTFQANNAVSIDQFDADFNGFNADKAWLHALADNSAFVRVEKSGFALQAYKRQEVFISAARQTAQLYSDINKGVLPSIAQSYSIDFDGYGIEQSGVGIEKTIELKPGGSGKPVKLSSQVRVYNIDRYREVQISGFAEAGPADRFAASVNAIERNTDLKQPLSSSNSTLGLGYSFDLSMVWPLDSRLAVFAAFRDLLNYNRIASLPNKTQRLEGAVGQPGLFSLFRPLPEIETQFGSEMYKFSLPTKATFGFEYVSGQSFLNKTGIEIRQIKGLTLSRVSFSWLTPFHFLKELEFGYENHFKSMDILAQFGSGGVRVGFDSLDDQKRRVEFLQVFFSLNI